MSSAEGDGPPPEAPQPDTAGEATQPAATPDVQAPEQSQDLAQAPSPDASKDPAPELPHDPGAQAEEQSAPLPESAPVSKEAVIPECQAYDRAKLQPRLQKSELGE